MQNRANGTNTSFQMPKEAVGRFVNASYRMVGTHSAVSVCHWTKESLRRGRVCYKERWYGIESHRCLEMTPSLVWCTHKCQFCWRPMDFTVNDEPKPDDPRMIIDDCIKQRFVLLTGFKGNDEVDKKKWDDSVKPTNAAISLAGEPTMYPRISDLISEFKKRGMSTFLVTNGTRPDRLKSLETEPTNLYVSLCAPDKGTYLKVNRPLIKDGWERLNESLELMDSFKCRTVLRLTLVKNLNMKSPEKYAELVKKANPNIIEPKGYSWVGESRTRLGEQSVPTMDDMREFSKQLADKTGYEIVDEDEPSKVFLLKR
jgi:tRNA wybutosine-synthesizing protein 1